MLLFTDGLVEERDSTLDDGLRRLAVAVDPTTESLDQLCDDVIAKLVPREKGDDVALLAARLVRA